jgi:hypothetical protein
MSDPATQAKSTALAGGAIASAILDVLFDKGILTLDESRSVLAKAMQALSTTIQTPEGYEASQIVASLQRGKFSARG